MSSPYTMKPTIAAARKTAEAMNARQVPRMTSGSKSVPVADGLPGSSADASLSRAHGSRWS